jgi:FkbM family methyltransferase
MHDEAIQSVYESILEPGDTAVDGGAHAGKHTIPMALAVGETGRVIAFEPLVEGRVRLLDAIETRQLTNVTVIDLALSDTANREVDFLFFPERVGISGFKRREGVDDLESQVRTTVTTTIDDWLTDSAVRFIKLDVEGAELLALRGASQTIDRSRPVIHVEAGIVSWRPFGYGAVDLHSWCGSNSYSCFDLVGNQLSNEQDLEASFTTPGVWDYILVPRGSKDQPAVAQALTSYADRFAAT